MWTTWYNLRTYSVEHTCKFTAMHVKNTYQICKYICFLHGYLAWWHQFREESVVSRKLSYRIDRMAIVRCRFSLCFDWFRLFCCYLHFCKWFRLFCCYLRACMMAINLLRACAVDTKTVQNKCVNIKKLTKLFRQIY